MKKLYTLLMCGVIMTGAIAQSSSTVSVPTPGLNVTKHIGFDKAKYSANKNKFINTASTQSVWVNYPLAHDSMFGNIAVLNANYLFWDSLPLAQFGTQWAAPWINNLGNVLDLTSNTLKQAGGVPTNWGLYNAYSVDSMSMLYAYERNYSNPNVVDTLIVKLYTNATASNLLTAYFTAAQLPNIQTDFGTDTITLKIMKYTFGTNSPNASGVMTYKIPLTAADTAITFYREKAWSTNMFPVPPGNKLIMSSITFKPGYPYQLGDTLNRRLNAFYFTAYEENGTGTMPTYQDCNYNSAGCDYNCSGIIRTDERYNTANAWSGGGYFIPKYAFTAPYGLESDLVSYKITSSNVGINETDNTGNVLMQNIPNPFNGNTVIPYELANGGNVSLEVYDITGNKVLTMNEGKKAAGKYSFELGSNSLQAGVYFYSLIVDGSKLTKKMTVIK